MGLIILGGLLVSVLFDIWALILAIIGVILAIIPAFNENKRWKYSQTAPTIKKIPNFEESLILSTTNQGINQKAY